MKSRNEVNTELQIMTWNGMNESIIVHICTHYHNKFTTHIYIYIERGNMLNHISWKIWIRQQVAELTTAPSAQLACNYHKESTRHVLSTAMRRDGKVPAPHFVRCWDLKNCRIRIRTTKLNRIAPWFKVKYVKWFKCHRKAPAENDTCHGTLRKFSNRTQLAVST